MPGRDLNLLIDAARKAGDIARPFWQGDFKVWDKAKDDPVTEADFAVDTFLKEYLLAARPEYGWLSEETEDDPARLSKSRVFIVDPIDGTRAFVAGKETWAHSIAIVEDSRPYAGVVYLPVLDKLYAAHVGAAATLNGKVIAPSTPGGTLELLSNASAVSPEHWPGGAPKANRHFRPSLAYRFCLVADGSFDAMFTFRDSWEWDNAAGALIAECAGCTASDRNGKQLIFNQPHPAADGLIVAPKALHIRLMSRRSLS